MAQWPLEAGKDIKQWENVFTDRKKSALAFTTPASIHQQPLDIEDCELHGFSWWLKAVFIYGLELNTNKCINERLQA